MASSNYEEVTWNEGDDLTLEKMQQMASNEAYLYSTIANSKMEFSGNNFPTVSYRGQLAIYAASVTLFPSDIREGDRTVVVRYLGKEVEFPGGLFAANSPVLVQLTPGWKSAHPKDISMTVTNRSRNGEFNWPDSSGCYIHAALSAETSNQFAGGALAVHLLAIGVPGGAESLVND